MTVVLRRVENTLKKVMRRRGGVEIKAALQKAEDNLAALEPPMTKELDAGLARLQGLVGRGETERPSLETLKAVCVLGDELLALCAVSRHAGLPEALNRLCLMADALTLSDFWTPGALDPAMDLATLCRSANLDDAVLQPLISGLDLCVAQYLKHDPASAAAP